MRLQAAAQALKKAEPLKDKIQHCKDLLNDNEAWVCQQQLQKIYQQVLILDLEYALDKKVEQELWSLGFKNYIDMLQCQTKDRINPKRSECQVMLSWCLEAASGFYLTLLQEICTAFDLDLPFRRKSYVYGCISPWKEIENIKKPHKSSCFYVCQYCLVHLGDIARYRNQYKQAELFYRHAVSLSPSSGQPYNQLALLEASRGNKLGTVFYYVRSVSVKHPFPVASTNLSKTLLSAANESSTKSYHNSILNCHEYVILFLKFHGILHNLGNLNEAKSYIKLLTKNLTKIIENNSFDSSRLIQMLIINIYAIYHIAGKPSESSLDLLKIEQLSSDEIVSRNCVLNVIAGNLAALLFPVNKMNNYHCDYLALPAIKLYLDWICLQPDILNDHSFLLHSQIWPNFCVLLNFIQDYIGDFEYEQFKKIPLPEDRIVQGFLPIEKSFETLRFSSNNLEKDSEVINKIRAVRLLNHGKYLAQYKINESTLINYNCTDESNGKFIFTSNIIPEDDIEQEIKLEDLNLTKEEPKNCGIVAEKIGNRETSTDEQVLVDKKVGILKPQSSLERSTCYSNIDTDRRASSDSLPSTKKTRQNIAMQAILRRTETEQKQVKFSNISPANCEEIKIIDNPTKNCVTQTAEIDTKQRKNNQASGALCTDYNSHLFNVNETPSNFQLNDSIPSMSNFKIQDFNNEQPVQKYSSFERTPGNNFHQNNPLSMCDNLQFADANVYHQQQQQKNIQIDSNNVMNLPKGSSQNIPTNYTFTNQSCEPATSSSSSVSSLSSSSSSLSSSLLPSSKSCHQQLNPVVFKNYEATNFNVWNDTQPPKPPATWWNTDNINLIDPAISLNNETNQNWQHSPIGEGSSHDKNHSNNKQFETKENNTNGISSDQYSNVSNITNTYSLFSGNSWGNAIQNSIIFGQEQPKDKISQQSLWSGPGPSPLERLLEQQKSLREGGT
ncbi:hypothetical protein HCN44_008656 [Aphidius gifuensis]|uniref:Protein SMG7 n=1 Tax=Aphidius gifuensis TaxID=684658 RepID=A0A834XND7_APHGI|nr:protein SMG7-like [Aphidius gifuensis]KAF7989982.1 hypothetical protein HCN44_008656 [Aphidius gifuensis]